VDARSGERLKVAQVVLKALRGQDFRSVASETAAQGQHVIIPALPDDPMGQFFEDFRQAEGTVYIATVNDGEVRVLSVSPAHEPRHAVPVRDRCPIYATTELGMVISLLELHRTPITFYEAPRNMTLNLVEGDELAIPSTTCS
jgi:hypothetical protein